MSHLLAHATPRNIGYLLIIAVTLWGAYKMIVWYAERQPIENDPQRYQVNPSNAANIIAAMPSLRTPLPQHRNQTVPADDWEELLALHGVCAEDRADIIRGSKLP